MSCKQIADQGQTERGHDVHKSVCKALRLMPEDLLKPVHVWWAFGHSVCDLPRCSAGWKLRHEYLSISEGSSKAVIKGLTSFQEHGLSSNSTNTCSSHPAVIARSRKWLLHVDEEYLFGKAAACFDHCTPLCTHLFSHKFLSHNICLAAFGPVPLDPRRRSRQDP